VLAGFSLALVFVILNCLPYVPELLGGTWEGERLAWFTIGSQAAAFLVPALLLLALRRTGLPVRLRWKGFSVSAAPFVLTFSLAVSILSFVLNYIISLLFPFLESGAADFSGAPWWLVLLASILVPAFCEEFFMRGALFSSFESCGTGVAVAASALAFAMVHGTMANFAGPLVAGLAYAYMAYALDSVWPAIFAHLLNNWLALQLSSLVTTYAAFGLWSYFLAFSVILFLVLLTFALRSLERLIGKGVIRSFQQGEEGLLVAVLQSFLSPGFILFTVLFLTKTIFSL